MITLNQFNNRQTVGLYLGLTLFIAVIFITTYLDIEINARIVAATATLMACWWLTEAIPIPVTALLPLAVFPLLNVMPMQDVALSYANHLIFLFLGGFLLAACIQRWGLHKRIALKLIQQLGTSPQNIILGFMIASAFLSMWVSNTATAMMMLPIGLALIQQFNSELPKNDFGTALMLSIAYACSIGGVATLIGTPPNAIFAGIAEKQLEVTISFFDWFKFAFPMATIFLILTWFYLVKLRFDLSKIKFHDNSDIIEKEIQKLGRLSSEEKRVLIVFLLTAAAWMLNGVLDIKFLDNIKDSTIAILAAIVLFIIPAKSSNTALLDWNTAKSIPWDILILFGGGFALATAFSESGLTVWLANQLTVLQGVNEILIIATVVLLVIFLTEITSNTATATIFIPLMIAFAVGMNIDPMLLMLPVAIASSYAFMLPVATPPNAIVFSSRQVDMMTMAKTGFWLNIVAAIIIVATITLIKPLI